jgi:hypothetical protein
MDEEDDGVEWEVDEWDEDESVVGGLDLFQEKPEPPPGPNVKSPFRFLLVIDFTFFLHERGLR